MLVRARKMPPTQTKPTPPKEKRSFFFFFSFPDNRSRLGGQGMGTPRFWVFERRWAGGAAFEPGSISAQTQIFWGPRKGKILITMGLHSSSLLLKADELALPQVWKKSGGNFLPFLPPPLLLFIWGVTRGGGILKFAKIGPSVELFFLEEAPFFFPFYVLHAINLNGNPIVVTTPPLAISKYAPGRRAFYFSHIQHFPTKLAPSPSILLVWGPSLKFPATHKVPNVHRKEKHIIFHSISLCQIFALISSQQANSIQPIEQPILAYCHAWGGVWALAFGRGTNRPSCLIPSPPSPPVLALAEQWPTRMDIANC